ncbi:hypothetical protein N9T47_03195, partial [Luminiphilus sp.]
SDSPHRLLLARLFSIISFQVPSASLHNQPSADVNPHACQAVRPLATFARKQTAALRPAG